MMLLFAALVQATLGLYSAASRYGDNWACAYIAAALRTGQIEAALRMKHFWGLPYAIVLASSVFGVSEYTAIILISVSASLGASIMSLRLYGVTVAGYFTAASLYWVQRSVLGGDEPLFVCCLLASFLAGRAEMWLIATALATMATATRPLGVFCLAGVALVLARRHEWRALAACIAIASLGAMLYVFPILLAGGDPLLNVKAYQAQDWSDGLPFTLPLVGLLRGAIFFVPVEPRTNTLMISAWVAFFLLFLILAATRFRSRAATLVRLHPLEGTFYTLYAAFLLTYNSAQFHWSHFPRFIIPLLPAVFVVMEEWLPRRTHVLWCLGLVSALLAAASAINARVFWQMLVS